MEGSTDYDVDDEEDVVEGTDQEEEEDVDVEENIDYGVDDEEDVVDVTG